MDCTKNNIKFIISTLICIALTLNSCNNTVSPIDSNSQIIKSETKVLVDINTVSQISIVYYKEFDYKSNLIVFKEFNSLGTIASQSEFKYSNLEKSEVKSVFNEKGDKVISELNNYVYSSQNGSLVKLTKSDTSGKIIGITSYTYDSKGNILKESEVSNSNNTTLYEKDFVYKYNTNGSLEGLTIKDAISNTVLTRDSIYYVSLTNTLEKYNLDAKGNITKINILYYNSIGRIIKETVSDKNGVINKKYIYNYTFF